jgi:Mn-dependent DtxR family transcriptional regulator
LTNLNFGALAAEYSAIDVRFKLITYIFEIQGGELQRLDFNRAAQKLGVSRKSISRYVAELAECGILTISDGKLQINSELIIRG